MNQNDSSEPLADDREIEARIRALAARMPEKIQLAVPLRELTTFQIGGPALGICRIKNTDDAVRFQALSWENGLPMICLGGGSNILADDRGFCGLVLKMEIDDFEVHEEAVSVGAGLVFDELVTHSLQEGLVGLEFASGIPGTVGGAIVGNAGCYGHEIGEFLLDVTLLRPDGRIVTVGPEQLGLGYRTSKFKSGSDLVLGATLRLHAGDAGEAWQSRTEKIRLRWKKHPRREPSAGSYFKNLPPSGAGARRRAAGELLEKAGAKSMRVGDAAVFAKHANIIINAGAATCQDVLRLAERMKSAVHQQFGCVLHEEVRYLPWQMEPVRDEPARRNPTENPLT